MLARLDSWISREQSTADFWVCQKTGITQQAVPRYDWMLARWTLVLRISFGGAGDRV